MNYSYRKLSNKNYLVLDNFDTTIPNNDYRIEMQKRNHIHGLLDLSTSIEDDVMTFHYDITSKQSLHSYFYDTKIRKEHILNFFNDLSNTLSTLDKYLLDYDNLVIIPQCIFCTKEVDQFLFAYCPNHQKPFYDQLKDLIGYFLTITDHNDEQTVLISYGLWQVVQNTDFNMDSLLSLINKTPPAPAVYETPPVEPKNNILKEPDVLLKENYTYEGQFVLKNAIIFSIALILLIGNIALKILNIYSMELFFIIMLAILMLCIYKASEAIKEAPLYRVFDKEVQVESGNILTITPPCVETTRQETLENNNNETVLLCINPVFTQHKLVYAGMDFVQEIPVESFPFSIGKSATNSFVIDNPAISRFHARIICENNLYFIEDLNSSNGTKINEKPIDSYTLTEITSSDTITFADLTYIFQ